MGRVLRAVRKWNIHRDAPPDPGWSAGPYMGSGRQPRGHNPVRYYNDRSIIGSIYNRIAVDLSMVLFYHALLDGKNNPIQMVHDNLNECLTLDPNIDQTSQAFFQDAALTMMEEGVVALVPVDADGDPMQTESFDIQQLRVCRIVGWFPQRVTVEVYDDREVDEDGKPVNGGVTKQITIPKYMCAIVENPFYNVMNLPSGSFQRLTRKLAMLDGIDEAAASGALDIILQLPYTVRGDARAKMAEERRDDLRKQLQDDELGVGYIDVSEKVIQLNRRIDNKLLEQIQTLLKTVYDELGITPEIMNGTASADAINQYQDRTVEPIANAFALEMKRKFLTKMARTGRNETNRHSIEFYRDPLRLIPIGELAEIVDKLLRNAAITANELRPKIGFMPSDDPNANKLMNPNMPEEDQPGGSSPPALEAGSSGGGSDPLDEVSAALDALLGDVDATG